MAWGEVVGETIDPEGSFLRERIVEEAEHFFGKDVESRGINIVGGVFMEDFPEPLDDVEIGAVSRKKVQMQTRMARHPSGHRRTGMIPRLIENNVQSESRHRG